MNMNNPLENLRQLTEAVRMAGADIAPTYIEYVQLAFAIANDCGEAGRNDFLSLCSLSSKYDEKNAQALFSNALHADKEDIHLGTVFHLAGQCGVKISGSAGFHKAGTMGTAGTAPFFLTHVRAYYKYDINPASFIKDFPLKRWMPYYYSMRISRLMQTMLFRNFFNFLFSSFIIFRFCRRSFYLFSFVFSLSGASLPLTLPHLLFFSTNYKNTHVGEEKRPGSAASASEVFLRSLPFFILPFFAFPLLLSILFPIFVR